MLILQCCLANFDANKHCVIRMNIIYICKVCDPKIIRLTVNREWVNVCDHWSVMIIFVFGGIWRNDWHTWYLADCVRELHLFWVWSRYKKASERNYILGRLSYFSKLFISFLFDISIRDLAGTWYLYSYCKLLCMCLFACVVIYWLGMWGLINIIYVCVCDAYRGAL